MIQTQTAPGRAIATQKRMTLASVVRGKLKKPQRIVLYGVEKIGKSTFGADAPSPMFIGAEDGTSELDVARFPEPRCWRDIHDAIQTLTDDPHDRETVVLDTLDWMEPLCWAHVCSTANPKVDNIESFGFGKGYGRALDAWRILLAALDALREKRRMGIILLAHAWVKQFKNPAGEDYDRYEMKLHGKSAGLIKEWADCVLFCNHETLTRKKGDGALAKHVGVSDGSRLIYTTRKPAWDAGNRYGLPETLPLSWSEFAAAVEAGAPADPAVLRNEIDVMLAQVDEDVRAKSEAWLKTGKNGSDALALSRLADRLRGKIQINEKSKEETAT